MSGSGKNMAARGIMGKLRDVVENFMLDYEEVSRYASQNGIDLFSYDEYGTMYAGMDWASHSWYLGRYRDSVDGASYLRGVRPVLSICGTELAVPFQGVVLNESTAAPLCAGLIFGSPAGVIAGVIGSVERYLASVRGAGYYGRYAGTFSILFAGLAGAGMRRYMFDDKKPAWYYGLASGIIAEVVDMLLLLAVNVDDMRSAFYVVEVAALPLAIVNGAAVMLALLGVSLVAGVRWKSDRSRERLTQTFQKLETAGGFFLDDDKIAEFALFPANIYEQDCLCMYMKSEGYYIMGALPKAEATFARDVSLYVSVFMEVLIFTLLFVLIYILTKNLIVDNILRVNDSLARITGGDLEEKVNVRTNQEFATLSDDTNTTVTALRHYIDEAAARLDKELLLARAIQRSALPGVFPPYPNRTEFEIWAGMRPAKEVGGDFYDFYLMGEDKLAFVIADVSGKGIPAAMFMMTVKTLLKNLAETGLPVEEVLTEANRQLCEHNQAEMFVTVWMGILDLETGVVSCACAGHNPPLLRSQDGSYSFVKFRPGLVLAGMEGIHYRKNEFTLLPGDTLYLYTDGVTEATDSNEKLYGEARRSLTISQCFASPIWAMGKNLRWMPGWIRSQPSRNLWKGSCNRRGARSPLRVQRKHGKGDGAGTDRQGRPVGDAARRGAPDRPPGDLSGKKDHGPGGLRIPGREKPAAAS